MVEPAESLPDVPGIRVAGWILAHEIQPLDLPQSGGVDHLDDGKARIGGDRGSPCLLEPLPFGRIGYRA